MTTILAVDDSVTMRRCLEIAFDGTEFNLVTAESSVQALEKVRELGPALVIADGSLSPSDGYELCRTIKMAQPSLPVVILSSKHNPFDASRGAEADGHIDKPFDTQVVQNTVRQIVESRSAVQAAPAARPGPPPVPKKTVPAPGKRNRELGKTMAFGRVEVPDMRQKVGAPRQNPEPNRPAFERGPKPQPAAGAPRPVAPRPLGGTMPGLQGPPGPPPPRPAITAEQPTTPAEASFEHPISGTIDGWPKEKALSEEGGATTRPEGAVQKVDATPMPQEFNEQLKDLGLSAEQVQAVAALSRSVVERVVWEVVPTLAETLIKEEIRRLTQED